VKEQPDETIPSDRDICQAINETATGIRPALTREAMPNPTESPITISDIAHTCATQAIRKALDAKKHPDFYAHPEVIGATRESVVTELAMRGLQLAKHQLSDLMTGVDINEFDGRLHANVWGSDQFALLSTTISTPTQRFGPVELVWRKVQAAIMDWWPWQPKYLLPVQAHRIRDAIMTRHSLVPAPVDFPLAPDELNYQPQPIRGNFHRWLSTHPLTCLCMLSLIQIMCALVFALLLARCLTGRWLFLWTPWTSSVPSGPVLLSIDPCNTLAVFMRSIVTFILRLCFRVYASVVGRDRFTQQASTLWSAASTLYCDLDPANCQVTVSSVVPYMNTMPPNFDFILGSVVPILASWTLVCVLIVGQCVAVRYVLRQPLISGILAWLIGQAWGTFVVLMYSQRLREHNSSMDMDFWVTLSVTGFLTVTGLIVTVGVYAWLLNKLTSGLKNMVFGSHSSPTTTSSSK